jgi:hypothetical protein
MSITGVYDARMVILLSSRELAALSTLEYMSGSGVAKYIIALTMAIPAKILCEWNLDIKILKTKKLLVASHESLETAEGRSSFELCPYF